MSYRMLIISGVVALGLLFAGGRAVAQHSHGGSDSQMSSDHDESEIGHSHEMAMIHGGQVTMTSHHHFEVLFTGKQMRVYVYDADQKPIADPKDVKASMTLMTNDKKSEHMDLHYVAPDPEKGRIQGHFYADRNMTGMKEGDMKAMFKMMGLEEDPIEFRTPVKIGSLVTYGCPMKDSAPAENPGMCPKCGMRMTKMENGRPMGNHMDHGHDGSGDGHGH